MKSRKGPLPYCRQDREYESTLHEYRIAKGYTIKDLSDISGVPQASISGLATGMVSPIYDMISKSGELKPWVKKIMSILNVSAEDLFPRYYCKIDVAKLVASQINDISLGRTQIDPAERLDRHSFWDTILTCIRNRYNERGANVIIYRFIFGMTFQEIGEKIGITRERVRQIEAKALRILRRPAIKKNIYETS